MMWWGKKQETGELETNEPENKKRIFVVPDAKMYICNLLAQYKKPKEIISLIKEEHNIKVSPSSISQYKKENKELIEKLRTSFLATINDVPIAQKKIRLERADELYTISQELRGGEKVNLSLKCLKEAREEVEGAGSGSVTFQQFNQYNALSDEELREKLKEVEEKIVKTNVIEQEA